jgi:predicted kinase
MMNKTLIIIRGISGSGKSTYAATLDCPVFTADDYFMIDGEYKFIPSLLPDAHSDCRSKVYRAMYDGVEKIAVVNTFTQEWEFKTYLDMAASMDYTVFSIIVENRHGNKNIHDVPSENVEKQRERFEVSL